MFIMSGLNKIKAYRMSTKLVNYNLPVELIKKIEEMSEGNKTALVIDLLNQAICMRNIPESYRDKMYSHTKRNAYEADHDMTAVESRNLIDGLWI